MRRRATTLRFVLSIGLLLAASALGSTAASALGSTAASAFGPGFPGASPAPVPTDLWVAFPAAPDTGPALGTARGHGIPVRDSFVDALVLDDAAAARALNELGFRTAGPLRIAPDETVLLLRTRRASTGGISPADRLAATPDLRILWSRDREALVALAGNDLPAELTAIWAPKALASDRLPARAPALPAAPRPRATEFSATVDEMVAQVTEAATMQWIDELSGAEPAIVGGSPFVFSTRYTYSSECDLAEQYVHEKFQAMGFTDVAYDAFYVGGGWNARNVIARLPGTETPERFVIVGGHLDSTSPDPYNSAPGANDNASGTAVMLAAAEILRAYSFRSTIVFIAFTGEEQGLYGSNHYAAGAFGRGDVIDAMINCDMVAYWNSSYALEIEGETFASSLMYVMDDACDRYTGFSTSLVYGAWGSDHVPFLNRNYPAFLAIEDEWSDYPCYHRTCDTANRQDADMLADVARAVVATAAVMAREAGVTSAGPMAFGDDLELSVAPNPAAGRTVISCSLPARGMVDLTVHDVTGKRVRRLVRGSLPAGSHPVAWDGRTDGGAPAAAGVYFVRLRVDDRSRSERIVRLP